MSRKQSKQKAKEPEKQSKTKPLPKIKEEARQTYFIKNIKFKPLTNKEKRLVSKNKRLYAKDDSWPLEFEKFVKGNWAEVFQLLEETPIKTFWLNENKYANILKEVVDVRYPNLQIINLNFNKMVSLECIAKLRAPVLQRIEFNENKINTIQCLRKCHFHHLEWINMSDNVIRQFSPLTQLSSPKLNRLEWKSSPFPLINEEIIWMLKIQSNRIKKIDCRSWKRLEQRKARNILLLHWFLELNNSNMDWQS